VHDLEAEAASLDELLAELVTVTAPGMLEIFGIGIDTAATLLVAAGDNPERLRSEAAWAHLCGVAPSKHPRARSPVTASTAAVTATPTRLCGASS
jgi:transposase